MKIIEWLKLPETMGIENLDDAATTLLHAEIIQKKPFLKKLYIDFYKQFKKAVSDSENKVLVELGSGGGFIKEIIGNIITSDVLELPNVDKIFSALDMPFEQASVDAFFMFNVLHHITEPKAFFKEALRCLKIGGKVVMIEPANTLWSRFIYKKFHHEAFDTQAPEWCCRGQAKREFGPCPSRLGQAETGKAGTLQESGPLSGENGALAWIIFWRDRKIFEREFPSLRIVSMRNHTPLRYVLSGGLILRQLVPSFSYPAVKAIEYTLSPINDLLGMFQTIELEKIVF
ncbi:MAG: class I SAM-dependent methyltransferase [Sedimentisphaerales bacterium]